MPVINTTVGGSKEYSVEAFNDSTIFDKGETVCLNKSDIVLEGDTLVTSPVSAQYSLFDTMYDINYPHNAVEFLTNNGVFKIGEFGEFIWVADIEPNYVSKYSQSENTYCRYDSTGKIDLVARVFVDGSVNIYKRTALGFTKLDGNIPNTQSGYSIRVVFTKDYIIYKRQGSSTDVKYAKFSISGDKIIVGELKPFSIYDGGSWLGIQGCSSNNIVLSGGQHNTGTYDLDLNKKLHSISRVMSGSGYGIYEINYPFTNTAGVSDTNIIKLRVSSEGIITEDIFLAMNYGYLIGTYLEAFDISICPGVSKYFDWGTKTFKDVSGIIYAPNFIYNENMGVYNIEGKDSSGTLVYYNAHTMFAIAKMLSVSTSSAVYKDYGDIQISPNIIEPLIKELYTSSGTNIYRLYYTTETAYSMSIIDTGSYRTVIDMGDPAAVFRRANNDAGYVFQSPWYMLHIEDTTMKVSNPSDILFMDSRTSLVCIGSSVPDKSVMIISTPDSVGTVILPMGLTYDDSFVLSKKNESIVYLMAINNRRAITYEFNIDNNQFTELNTTIYNEFATDSEREYSFRICYNESQKRIIRTSGNNIQVFKITDNFSLELLETEAQLLKVLVNNEKVLFIKPIFDTYLFIGTTARGFIVSIKNGAYTNHPFGPFFSLDNSPYKSFGLRKESEFGYVLCMYNQNGFFEQYGLRETKGSELLVDKPSTITMKSSSLTGIYKEPMTNNNHAILVLPYLEMLSSTITVESPNDIAIIKGTIE